MPVVDVVKTSSSFHYFVFDSLIMQTVR